MASTTSLLARHQRGAFGPAAVNVDECQAVHEIALMRPAAVLHQVGLAIARRRFIRVGKSPYRYALSEGRANAPAATPPPPGGFPHRPREPVDGRRADVQDRASHRRVEPQMPVALHALD